MKKLYLLRHAQKAQDYKDDYTRELSEQGFADAKSMALSLAKEGVIVDGVLCSPATRTRQSAEIFAKELGFLKPIFYNQTLYMGYVNEIKEVLSYTHDEINSLLLVGHNPSLSALAITLSDEFREDMKMGSVVEFEFDTDSWLDISKHNAKFIKYRLL